MNTRAENWSEAELFPVFRDCDIAIKGISAWRVGFWGVKDSQFTRRPIDDRPAG